MDRSTLCDDPLLTVQEAADYLRVSYRTVLRYIEQHHLPVLYLGGARRSLMRVRKSQLEAWIAAHMTPPEGE